MKILGLVRQLGKETEIILAYEENESEYVKNAFIH